jgi:O-antigen/teichoic acid export membrane protein
LVGATMLFNLALNIWLIPRYSFTGAATAFFCSHAFLFVAGMIVASRIIPYSRIKLFIDTFKAFISVALMGFAIYFLNGVHFIVLIMVGALIYFVFLFILRGLRIEELKFFYQSVFKRENNAKNPALDN